MKQRITRRDFLKIGIGTAAALGSQHVLTGCSDDGPTGSELNPDYNAHVAAIRGTDLDSMARDAIDAIGGIENIIHKGDTVFIKPNMVTLPWARTTN